ncbi:MAG TPA: pilin [Candidatus Paceibacterota bacterium]
MNKMDKKFIWLPAFLMLFLFFVISSTSAYNISINCKDGVCVTVEDNLPDDATGINPAQPVTINFFVVDEEGVNQEHQCTGGKKMFYALRHNIEGSVTNYEYIKTGEASSFEYQFSSGVDQQANRYSAVFYCYTANQGTQKSVVDSLVGQLSAFGQSWISPEFNQRTRAATIDPDCDQVGSCSGYPIQNDCEANRCEFSPACSWTSSACVANAAEILPSVDPNAGATQSFELPNPIGITTFEDLVNILGRWIFNISIPIAVAVIIWAGVLMLTAGAEPKRFQEGLKALRYAVIGLAIVLIGKGFVSLIQSILSLSE